MICLIILYSCLQIIFVKEPTLNKTFEAQNFICYRNTKHKIRALGSKYNIIILLANPI